MAYPVRVWWPRVVRGGRVGVLVLVVVALQLGVPALAFRGDRPAMLGWQMYAGLKPLPTVSVTTASGALWDLAPEDITPVYRPDVPYEHALGRYACRTVPGAVSVVVDRAVPAYHEVVDCV